MDTTEQIMALAESEHDMALAALQEALSMMSESQKLLVLNYLQSEED